MTVGNTPGSTQLNFMAGQIAVQLREAALAAQRLSTYVNGIGVSGLTEAGFSNADASAFLDVVAEIGILSGIYFGQQAIPTATDFSALVQNLAGPS
jgi:hypothetical protein